MNNVLLALANPFPAINPSQSIGSILQLVFGIIGAVTFLVLVLAGFKFVISRGDPQAVAKAKETILYAVIGLVVTLSASIIVNFVFRNL